MSAKQNKEEDKREEEKKVKPFSLDRYSRQSSGRLFMGIVEEKEELPDLNEVQVGSYKSFFQLGVKSSERENTGLQELFNGVFPFISPDSKVRVEFLDYSVELPKISIEEAIDTDQTYSAGVRALFRVVFEETGEIKEQEVFMGAFPYMTESGTFIINGAERVVVSQVHRSPGVVFDFNTRGNFYYSRLIPEKGSWLEFEVVRGIVYIRIDRRIRLVITSFLRAMGYEKNEEILELFYKAEEVVLSEKKEEELVGRYFFESVLIDKDKDESYPAGVEITPEIAQWLKNSGLSQVKLVDAQQGTENHEILDSLLRDEYSTGEDVCRDVYTVVHGNAPGSKEVAEEEFNRMFFKRGSYDLGVVGRYKLNKRFGYKDSKNIEYLDHEDVLNTIKNLILVYRGEMGVDDIDHLGNRRVRLVGEQLTNHLKVAFSRMQRLANEKLSAGAAPETITPQTVLSIKPVTTGIKEFFGTSQLSQFMDQSNPLSMITHKRRLNSLGPGGLTRERAGFEVRDVHYSHYGKICPIETPEGPNIGLIVSLGAYSRVNKYGFIETPYYKVKNGSVTKEVEYLSAIEEDRYFIMPFLNTLGSDWKIQQDLVPVRNRGNYHMDLKEKVSYMDVSPKQIISISTSLIPFLEHDDANRALMGSNMQRQAVPLIKPQAPIVGTGIEREVAKYSGFLLISDVDGEVVYVDSYSIEIKVDETNEVKRYLLKRLKRTNQDVLYNQRPVVRVGDKVKKGDFLSDGPAVESGELALGRNILTAFMTWEGYNYEDAILMSEDLLKEDAYTSIHIEEFDVEVRETKLGREYVTRDVPSILEEDAAKLDDQGVIRVGMKVKSGSILVGKVTPKGHVEVTPEYKLLYSIFGEKAKDVKDTSLRAPYGTSGTVIEVKHYDRDNSNDLKPGVIEKIKVYIAKKKKLKEGDKFAGRHGNKGVVARILPVEDMPYMEDGRPLQLVLNPLGVPSRMNIGQVYELVLGLVGAKYGEKFAVPVFNNRGYKEVEELIEKSGLPDHGLHQLYDGRTGEPFKNKVTVGYMYYLKLAHLADDKIHARSTGPYSLVTQQPLGGKAQFGGQRVGEMEVWAVEAYGAANMLQEFLTVKADAMEGRARIYEAIIKGEYVNAPGMPESFNVLIQELRGLALNLEVYDEENRDVFQNVDKQEKIKKRRLV